MSLGVPFIIDANGLGCPAFAAPDGEESGMEFVSEFSGDTTLAKCRRGGMVCRLPLDKLVPI
jgi:hypothetical protein